MKNNKKYTNKEINKAGHILINPTDYLESLDWAFTTLSEWRANHSYPINTFQATLRRKLKIIDNKGIVAQRLKRLPSILNKLERYPTMQLSRMNDIGGLRAVLGSLSKVEKLKNSYIKSKFTHKLVKIYDYIEEPKSSGYRGIHLVYEYSKGNLIYNGLKIEIQLRTKLQHAWATAVETLGIFVNSSLKSSEGPKEYLEFFKLCSSAFSFLEKTNPVPGFEQSDKEKIFEMVTKEQKRLKVIAKLDAYKVAISEINQKYKTGSYFILQLDPIERKLRLKAFEQDALEEATKTYIEMEKSISKEDQKQIVLVSSTSIENLKRAFPNYFLDTAEFIKYLIKLEILLKK